MPVAPVLPYLALSASPGRRYSYLGTLEVAEREFEMTHITDRAPRGSGPEQRQGP